MRWGILCLLLAGCANPSESGDWNGQPWRAVYLCEDGKFSSQCNALHGGIAKRPPMAR